MSITATCAFLSNGAMVAGVRPCTGSVWVALNAVVLVVVVASEPGQRMMATMTCERSSNVLQLFAFTFQIRLEVHISSDYGRGEQIAKAIRRAPSIVTKWYSTENLSRTCAFPAKIHHFGWLGNAIIFCIPAQSSHPALPLQRDAIGRRQHRFLGTTVAPSNKQK